MGKEKKSEKKVEKSEKKAKVTSLTAVVSNEEEDITLVKLPKEKKEKKEKKRKEKKSDDEEVEEVKEKKSSKRHQEVESHEELVRERRRTRSMSDAEDSMLGAMSPDAFRTLHQISVIVSSRDYTCPPPMTTFSSTPFSAPIRRSLDAAGMFSHSLLLHDSYHLIFRLQSPNPNSSTGMANCSRWP